MSQSGWFLHYKHVIENFKLLFNNKFQNVIPLRDVDIYLPKSNPYS